MRVTFTGNTFSSPLKSVKEVALLHAYRTLKVDPVCQSKLMGKEWGKTSDCAVIKTKASKPFTFFVK